MQVVVLDGYTLNPGDNPWDTIVSRAETVVYDRTPVDQIVERAMDAEIILTNKTPLSAETISSLPKLQFISVLATGFNVVDVATAREKDIPVSNVPTYGTDAVAEYVFAVLLSHCHQPTLHDRAVRAGQWNTTGDFCFWNSPLIELSGKTMGIVGYGCIGRRVGKLAHAFGMRVLAHDVMQSNPPNDGPFEWKSINDIFRESDVVSLHCPQTDETVGMVGRALIARMKPTAYLINAARGGLINEPDLAEALEEGKIAGAALDVLSSEPPAKDNPLLAAKNCLLTPHIAWATFEARKRLMAVTADNVAAFINGRPINVVN